MSLSSGIVVDTWSGACHLLFVHPRWHDYLLSGFCKNCQLPGLWWVCGKIQLQNLEHAIDNHPAIRHPQVPFEWHPSSSTPVTIGRLRQDTLSESVLPNCKYQFLQTQSHVKFNMIWVSRYRPCTSHEICDPVLLLTCSANNVPFGISERRRQNSS